MQVVPPFGLNTQHIKPLSPNRGTREVRTKLVTRHVPIITDKGAINQRFETSVNLEAGAKPTIHGITHPGIPLLRRAHQQGKDSGKGVRRTCQVEKLAPSSQSVPGAMAAERATDKDGDVEMESKDSSVRPLLAENLGRAALGADSPSFALSKVCTSEVAGSAPQQITCGYVVSRSLLSGPMAILCVELRYKGTSRLQKERKHHRTRTSSCFPRLISRRDVSPSEMMAPLVCGHTP